MKIELSFFEKPMGAALLALTVSASVFCGGCANERSEVASHEDSGGITSPDAGGTALRAGGYVHLSSGAWMSGFDFPAAGALLSARMGSCEITRAASGGYDVVVALYGNPLAAERAVRAITITSTPVVITADLGGDHFTPSGVCTIDVSVVNEAQGDLQVRGTSCALTFGTEAATTEIDLVLSGCTVR